MAEGYIQVPSDSVGKKVDTTELTRADGSVVERQRVEIPDPIKVQPDLLEAILIELRVISFVLSEGFNISDRLEGVRSDLSERI